MRVIKFSSAVRYIVSISNKTFRGCNGDIISFEIAVAASSYEIRLIQKL